MKSKEPINVQELQTIEINDKEEKILNERMETGMIEGKGIESVDNLQMKNNGLGGFLKKIGGKIKGQKISKEPTVEKSSKKKQEKLIEEKIETGASEIQVTEIQNDGDVKNKSGGFIQDWGQVKGHLRSRRATIISPGQEQVMEKNGKEKNRGMEEKVETGISEVKLNESPQNNVEFIQNWGRLKDRMKSKEPSKLNLHQEEKLETIEVNEKEIMKEKIETETTDIEIKEITANPQEKKGGKGRIARRQPKNTSVQQGEKSQIKKEEVLEDRIEAEKVDIEGAERREAKNSDFIRDWGNLKSRMKSKESTNGNPPQGKTS